MAEEAKVNLFRINIVPIGNQVRTREVCWLEDDPDKEIPESVLHYSLSNKPLTLTIENHMDEQGVLEVTITSTHGTQYIGVFQGSLEKPVKVLEQYHKIQAQRKAKADLIERLQPTDDMEPQSDEDNLEGNTTNSTASHNTSQVSEYSAENVDPATPAAEGGEKKKNAVEKLFEDTEDYDTLTCSQILNISGASDGKYSLGGMLVENQIPGPPKQLTVSQWQSNIGGELKKILDRAHELAVKLMKPNDLAAYNRWQTYLNTRKANKDADQAQKTAVDNQKPAFSDVRKGLFAYRIAQAVVISQWIVKICRGVSSDILKSKPTEKTLQTVFSEHLDTMEYSPTTVKRLADTTLPLYTDDDMQEGTRCNPEKHGKELLGQITIYCKKATLTPEEVATPKASNKGRRKKSVVVVESEHPDVINMRTRKVNLVQTYSLSGSFTKALQDATEHDCPNMVFEEQWEDEAWATLVAYVQQHLVKGKLKSEYAAIQNASDLKKDYWYLDTYSQKEKVSLPLSRFHGSKAETKLPKRLMLDNGTLQFVVDGTPLATYTSLKDGMIAMCQYHVISRDGLEGCGSGMDWFLTTFFKGGLAYAIKSYNALGPTNKWNKVVQLMTGNRQSVLLLEGSSVTGQLGAQDRENEGGPGRPNHMDSQYTGGDDGDISQHMLTFPPDDQGGLHTQVDSRMGNSQVQTFNVPVSNQSLEEAMVIVPGAAGAGVPPVDPYARVTVRPVQDVDPSLPGTSSGVNLPYGGQRRTYTIAPSDSVPTDEVTIQEIAGGNQNHDEPAPPGCEEWVASDGVHGGETVGSSSDEGEDEVASEDVHGGGAVGSSSDEGGTHDVSHVWNPLGSLPISGSKRDGGDLEANCNSKRPKNNNNHDASSPSKSD